MRDESYKQGEQKEDKQIRSWFSDNYVTTKVAGAYQYSKRKIFGRKDEESIEMKQMPLRENVVKMVGSLAITGIVLSILAWCLVGGSNADRLKAVQTVLGVVGGLGAAVALVVSYRRQQLSEEGDFTLRFESAANQLGSDKAAIRMAGAYAMARLADDWKDQRQVCIDVLCAYIRMPYDPDPTSTSPPPGENEVRFTIIKLIRDHLQEGGHWAGNNFNFRGATFDGGDFSKVAIRDGTTLNFGGATFLRGTVNFESANFSGGEVDFRFATFSSGRVDFSCATFSDHEVTIVNLSATKCNSNGKQVVFLPSPVPDRIRLPHPQPDCFPQNN